MKIALTPQLVHRGGTVQISGAEWPLDAIVFTIGKKEWRAERVLSGLMWNGLVVPATDGTFALQLTTENLPPGRISIRAESRSGGKAEAHLTVEELERDPEAPREKVDKYAIRGEAFRNRRVRDGVFPHDAGITMRRDWIDKYGPRKRPKIPGGGVFFIAPIPGTCNWVPLGPAPYSEGKGSSFGDNAGRIRSLAIDPLLPSRMYAGAATGGVWKSTDAGWLPKTDDKFSLAIGALAIDPVTPNIVYAGTGEYVPGDPYYYYGRGLLRSIDHGDTWSEVGTSEFNLAEIARIVINPLDTTNLFVAASNGLWESTTSGASWTQLLTDGCTDVVLVQNPAEAGTRRLLAAIAFGRVRTASNGGTGWSTFSEVTMTGAPATSRRIVFGVCRTQPRTIYAAFAGVGGEHLAHVTRSDDWGVNWDPRTIPASTRLWAPYYNLVIQPHPTNPDTVLLGVVDVFKSTTGGGDWTNVSGTGLIVHSDVHTIVWHPSDPNRVFVGCDGGIAVTPDLCASWEVRNLDLANLQLYDLGQHPVYDAVMIAGMQDNGGAHYTGAPIWRRTWVAPGVTHNSMGGDGTVAQIDPFDGRFHYYGGAGGGLTRSDNAGRLFGAANWGPFPGFQWWPAFYPDPRTPGVVFTGGNRVWRSEDRATTNVDITADLAMPVRSIGFHPTNARVVYAGTMGGQVYRLTGPAAGAWTSSTVMTENITLTGLPAGIGISSIAVDPAGNVWVTSSDIFHTEATGELSNQHVFRLDAGATAWVAKSDGLVVANPINAIVIDPADATRLFCGGDRGAFRWDAALNRWHAMDEGLPNAPITKLVIHAPSRKLRAATFGRGVWERELEPGTCSDHFLYLRDNLVDSGRTPSPDNVAHPYLDGERCWHWQSEDIIVDSTFQTTALLTSPMDVYDKVVHDGARRGANRVYVTVHNKGPFAVTNVEVRAFFAAAAAGLPPLPSGLLASPFTWNPLGGPSPWTPVSGTSFVIPRIEPGTTRLARWEFPIPMSANRHSCLLAFVTSTQDPFSTGGITDPDELVVNNRKVALRNLDLEAMPGSGSGGGSGTGGGGFPPGFVVREIELHGHEASRVALICGNLPDDALVFVAGDRETRKRWKFEEPKPPRRAEKVRDEFLRASQLKDVFVREPKRGAELDFGELQLDRGRPVTITVALHARKWDPEQTYTLDVVQFAGRKVKGGYTIRIEDPKQKERIQVKAGRKFPQK